MKKVLLLLLLAIGTSVPAASFLWNQDFVLGEGSEMDGVWSYTLIMYHTHLDTDLYGDPVEIRVEKDAEGRVWVLSGWPVILLSGETLIVASPGDVVSSETIADESRIFFSGTLPTERFSATVKYEFGKTESLYFGFSTKKAWAEEPVYYGWVELIANDSFLTLGNTYVDLNGRPVVVGARPEEPIPEPASGALALLGAALLFRRRRNFPH